MRSLTYILLCLIIVFVAACDSDGISTDAEQEVPIDSTDVPSPPDIFPARLDSALISFVSEGGDKSGLSVARLSKLREATMSFGGLLGVQPLTFQASSDSLIAIKGTDLVVVSAKSSEKRIVPSFLIGIIGNHSQVTWPKSSPNLYLNPRVHYSAEAQNVASLPINGESTETVLFEEAVPIASRVSDVLVYFPSNESSAGHEVKIYNPLERRFVPTLDGSRLVIPTSSTINFIRADFDSRNAGLAIVTREVSVSPVVYSVYFAHIGFTNLTKIWETEDQILSVMTSVDGHVYLEIHPGSVDEMYLARVSYKNPSVHGLPEIVLERSFFPGVDRISAFRSSHVE